MLAFWPDVIAPILTALAPSSIVEIGSESGKTTTRLIALAAGQRSAGRPAVVHAIDPAPRFDAEAWMKEHGETFVMHRAPSLTALPTIAAFDVVLIDGDHNWYTVYEELKLIERLCQERESDLPLMLLHDIAWPYGRRDLYYDPDAIPQQHRQPWDRRGISPTESELLPKDKGGFNAHLANALHEGGDKNGVLTAVEDFLDQSDADIELVRIPAVFGLGILLPRALAEARPTVARLVRAWSAPQIERFIDRLETARIAMLTGIAR